MRPPKPNLMEYAESYLENRWDEDHWGDDPSREEFMAAVKDFAEWIDGAVGDCFIDWSAEFTTARQAELTAAAMDARPVTMQDREERPPAPR